MGRVQQVKERNQLKMAEEEDNAAATTELDHQVCLHLPEFSCSTTHTLQAAYIFNPLGDNEQEGKPRPAKRRKKSRNSAIATEKQPEKKLSCFVPLFNGGEDHRCTALREELFESAWSSIETRIQVCEAIYLWNLDGPSVLTD